MAEPVLTVTDEEGNEYVVRESELKPADDITSDLLKTHDSIDNVESRLDDERSYDLVVTISGADVTNYVIGRNSAFNHTCESYGYEPHINGVESKYSGYDSDFNLYVQLDELEN